MCVCVLDPIKHGQPIHASSIKHFNVVSIFENAQLPIASHSSGRVAAVEYHFLAPRMDQLK